MKKLIIAIVVLIVLGILAVLVFSKNEPELNSNTVQNAEQTNSESSPRQELIIGDNSAPVTIIEYVDYKCPNCNQFHRTTFEEIKSQFIDNGKAKLIIRSFPNIGPDSGRASRGAYCANDQNVFYQYHDKVLEYMWENFYQKGDFASEIEDVLTSDVLTSLISDLGINAETFKTCLNDEEKNKLIDSDLLLAAADDVRGTPTFKIGNQVFAGKQPFSVFKTLIEIVNR